MSSRPSVPPHFGFTVPPYAVLVELDTTREAGPLHPAEEALLHPRATATRRNEFRTGRRAAHQALAALGRDAGPVMRGSHHEPMWPPGVVGSIAHGAGVALAGVAPRSQCGGIGLDIEHIDRAFPQLIDQIATPAERERLERLDGDVQRRAMLEVFVAKECIYKALFPRVGRYFGFEAAETAATGPGLLLGRLRAPLVPDLPPTQRFEIQIRWRGNIVAAAVFLDSGG